MRLFVDTGPLVAAVHTRDARHADALRIFERIGQREWTSVQTSDYVLAEALNFVTAKLRRRDAAEHVLEFAFGSEDAPAPITKIARVHGPRFAAALDRYRRRFDDGLSFTDHTSLVVMEEEGIGQIATFDRGFRTHADVVDG